ncbi:MAG: aminotransferase class I/II-fold pyridoxal phosphate-dependent enzyme [Saprospiraceae bacterium]|nr:aminotransferase class I/II-fold pyridoxal phosphate-dependent enzyme [Saprospiraceae bacterium]MCB9326519.1 aminotransferase class I/II-fold pyridoxal phosphate-dependent enzyme [Lewinellaceae bacterium]
MKQKHIETLLSHYAEDRERYRGAVVPPIFQNSLFTHPDWESIDAAFDDRVDSLIYSRGHNPTVRMVEQKLAAISGAERALLFPSGMAAISAVVMHCLEKDAHVITIKNIYGPANNLLNTYLPDKMGIEVTQVSGEMVEEFEQAIRPNTRLIYLESPSSAVFSLQDIRAVAALAKKHGIKTAIDNSWASPMFQRPLEMGIDLEIHSISKYIGGHSDLVGGCVMGSEKDIKDIFVREFELLGAKTAPFEAWLVLRSLRTLPIRMRQHQENAMAVAAFLENHPKIALVRYPGLESFPQRDLALKQMSGFTGLMGFRLATENLEQIKAFFNSLEIFRIGVSWGGHESLIYAPAISYLKELKPEQFEAMGISLGDMRISVGLEHKEDLIADLEQALGRV